MICFSRVLPQVFKQNWTIIGQTTRRLSVVNNIAKPIARSNPIVMKLDTQVFHSIFTEELNVLVELFKKYGYELRIAGGAVRDLLLGKKPDDLDFASVATPDEMKTMFQNENIRILNTKGEKHGTITPRINDRANFEITTLRIDVKTDGRHAEVCFTTDWKLDSNRRDLTINSMFLGLDGTVYDYFHGYDDLLKRKVVFVGDANLRIKEDYLRILRYFRFYGRIAEKADEHDEYTIDAIKANVAGMAGISGERIWMELNKILPGRYAKELIIKIIDVGLAPYIGLTESPNVDNFSKIMNSCLEHNLQLRSITMMTALLRDELQVLDFHKRMKLSSYDRDLALFIACYRDEHISQNSLKKFYLLMLNSKTKQDVIKQYTLELLKYKCQLELYQTVDTFEMPSFPLSAIEVVDQIVVSGRELGNLISALKTKWVEDNFTTTKEQLLQFAKELHNKRIQKKAKK